METTSSSSSALERVDVLPDEQEQAVAAAQVAAIKTRIGSVRVLFGPFHDARSVSRRRQASRPKGIRPVSLRPQ